MLTREHTIEPIKLVKSAVCVALSATLCIGFYVPTSAFAVTAAEKQAEADAALSSLNAMQAKLDESQANYYTAVDEHAAALGRMEEAEGRIEEATDQIKELQDQLAIRARNMYRTGSSSFIDLLFGSTSFHALATNWDILNDMNQKDADMVEETKNLREEVEEEKAVYAEQEKVAEQKVKEMNELVEEATNLYSEQQALYDSLSAEAKELYDAEQAAAAAAVTQGFTYSGGGGSNWSMPEYSSVTGNAIVDRAIQCLEAPYIWGACGPGGFDCSGLVSYAVTGSFSRLGTTKTFMGYAQVSDPQPGDICTSWDHCGIYVGGGQMIHAPQPGESVCYTSVQSGMIYVRHY